MVGAVVAAIRPANQLVQMPEPRRVDAGVGARLNACRQEYCNNAPWDNTTK
jgi:hypothetical protein